MGSPQDLPSRRDKKAMELGIEEQTEVEDAQTGRKQMKERSKSSGRGLGLTHTSWRSVFPGHAPGLTKLSFPVCKTIQIRKLLRLFIKPYEIEIWSMRNI